MFANLPPQELVFFRDFYVSYSVVFKQDIYNPVSLRRLNLSRDLVEVQRLLLSEKKREVVSSVREAYINALKLKALSHIYLKQEESVKAHLRDVESMYEEGLVAFKDVLETKVKLQEVREKLSSVRAGYRKALNYLSYLVGESVDTVQEPAVEIHELWNRNLSELVDIALRNRAIVKVARKSVIISEKGVEMARASFYPVLSFEGIYRYSEESNVFPNSIYLVSLVLRWNVFGGMARVHNLRLQELSRDISRIREEDLKDKLRLSIANILEELKSLREKLNLAETRLREAREHLRIAKEKYMAGLGTNTEVIDAQTYLTSARKSLEMTRYDMLLWKLKLSEELGYEK
jgi:outer membrane protein TolC